MIFKLQHCLDLPQNHKRPDWDALPISPDGSKISISTGPTELTILDSVRGLAQDAKLAVPPETRRVAAHPSQGPIAAITDRQLILLDDSGATISLLDVDPTWGEPRAISYDKSGQLLCLSTETKDDDVNLLFVLDARNLARLGRERLNGETDSGHYMVWHPTQEVLAIDVACGQDGTWLNLVDVTSAKCSRFPTAPDSFQPFGMASFSSDGTTFAGCESTGVKLWSFPDCVLLKELELPEGEFTSYVASFHQGHLLVPVESEDGNSSLLILGGALEERARLEFPLAGLSNYALPGGVIVSTMATHTKIYRVIIDG
jgi:hypothetical protein